MKNRTYYIIAILFLVAFVIFFNYVSCGKSRSGSSAQAALITLDATDITSHSATLNGIINPIGLDTDAYFEYGISATPITYPISTTPQTIGNGGSDVAISATVGSLTYSALYNFRVLRVNENGITYGNNLAFTTLPPAVDDYCWVANAASNNVTRILKADSTTTNITVGTGPRGVAVDETYCWVANNGSNNVFRILKSNPAITTTITAGTNPWGIAVDGTYCWVVNWTSNTVTRILKSDLSTTNIAVGTGPYSVGDMTGYAYDNYSRVP